MRSWNQLYSSLMSKQRPVSSSLISNLRLGVMESYRNGITLKKECQEQKEKNKWIVQNNSQTSIVDEKLEDFMDPPEEVEKIDVDFEQKEKLQFYIDLVFSNDIKTKEDLYHCLPSVKEDSNFYYLSKILYTLAKEKKDYLSIIGDFEGEDYEHILKEVEFIEQKMSWIHEYMLPKLESEEIEDIQKNSLVYLETSSNNACVLSDLKSNNIPIESYPSFLRLFRSLEEGIFPGLRKLQTNASLFEVKDGASRVVFTRVYKNYYCILTAFVKKCLWERELRVNLNNAEDNYNKQSSSIYQFLEENNSEYLSRQQQFEGQLFSLLDRGQKDIGGEVKCKQY